MSKTAQRWQDLVGKLVSSQNSSTLASSWWKQIETKYGESQRYYHTMNHINEMFKHFANLQDKLERPGLVSLAIYFHDVIYEPTMKDNEEQSAELFKQFAEEALLDENDTKVVYQWIVDTKAHKGIPGRSNCDLNLFIDMDLAIFGTPRDEYKTYAKNIRKEYIHVPEDAYLNGRATVLEHFLPKGSDTIFKSQIFIDMLEEKAIENINWEIEELKKGLIE